MPCRREGGRKGSRPHSFLKAEEKQEISEDHKVGQRKEYGEAEITSERQREGWSLQEKERGMGARDPIGHDSLVEAGARRHHCLGVRNRNFHSHPRALCS